jgi:hypothetical protein
MPIRPINHWPGLLTLSRFTRSTLLVCLALSWAGCARKSLDPVTAETLIGRWGGVTKEDADQGNAKQDARTLTGETVAFRYEFRADHSYETSMELTGGMTPLMPQVAGKHAVSGTWKVVDVGPDTLTVEFPDVRLAAAGPPAPRVKIVFQTNDRCMFNAESDEAMVLTRLP